MSLNPKFIEMLRGGIGTRSQLQFAQETGLTPEYISRILNGKTDAAPRMATLEKIATHTSRYGLNDYLRALGQDPVEPEARLRADTSALNRFLKAHTGEGGDCRTVSDLRHNTNWPVPGVLRKGESSRTPMALRSEFGDTGFQLFQYRIYDREYAGVVYFIVTTKRDPAADAAIDTLVINPHAIDSFLPFALFGTTDHVSVWNSILYPMTGDSKEQDAVLKEIDRTLGTSAEEKLLISIFGEKKDKAIVTGEDGREYCGTRLQPVVGFGFRYDEYVPANPAEKEEPDCDLKIPDEFRSFLFRHAGSFCRTEEEIKLFHELLDTDEDPRDIFFEYQGGHARKTCADDFDCCGTGAAVATVLSREYQGRIPGGFQFIRTPEAIDPKQPGYVLIAPNHGMDYCDTDITMKEILPVFSAAKELGIKEFGACYTFDSVPELKKTRTWKTKSFHLEF